MESILTKTACIARFRELRVKVRAIEQTVLQMMRHPCATQEQCMIVRNEYRDLYAAHLRLREALSKKFPDNTYYTAPWNEKE